MRLWRFWRTGRFSRWDIHGNIVLHGGEYWILAAVWGSLSVFPALRPARCNSMVRSTMLTDHLQPERIQGKPYTIRADVWSLGLTLHEIAHLRFPFPPEGENEYVAPIELLSYIVTAPVPVMIDDESIGRVWSDAIKSFMSLWQVRIWFNWLS